MLHKFLTKFIHFCFSLGSQKSWFLSASKNVSFPYITPLQICNFWSKSGPTRFWHILFDAPNSNFDEKHSDISTFSLETHHKITRIIKKRQGFSLVLKINGFAKLQNLWKYNTFEIPMLQNVTKYNIFKSRGSKT